MESLRGTGAHQFHCPPRDRRCVRSCRRADRSRWIGASGYQNLLSYVRFNTPVYRSLRLSDRRGNILRQAHTVGQPLDGVRSDPNADVSALSWRDFEVLVGEGFRHRGFMVTERGGVGPDGGVDLSMARNHERFLVQCKQWRAQQVGVAVVRELYGVMTAERVAGGYVVTSGSFTKDAKAFAAGRNIELMDGKALNGLLRDGRSAVLRPVDSMSEIGGTTPRARVCPKCRSSMVLRTAKRGANVGSSFWGCAQYPKCRETVGIG